MLHTRNGRTFVAINVVVNILFAVMMFLIGKVFSKADVVEFICMAVISLMLAFLCMALNTISYVAGKKD